jgi:hypothetical protein
MMSEEIEAQEDDDNKEFNVRENNDSKFQNPKNISNDI